MICVSLINHFARNVTEEVENEINEHVREAKGLAPAQHDRIIGTKARGAQHRGTGAAVKTENFDTLIKKGLSRENESLGFPNYFIA